MDSRSIKSGEIIWFYVYLEYHYVSPYHSSISINVKNVGPTTYKFGALFCWNWVFDTRAEYGTTAC